MVCWDQNECLKFLEWKSMKKMKNLVFAVALWPFFIRGSQVELVRYRYEALKPLIKNYERAWTFLELWGKTGDLSFKIASKFVQAVCVVAESENSAHLFDECKRHSLQNLLAVKNDLTLNNLIDLSDCEHIDCTFAPDFTLSFTQDWQKAVDAVLNMGDFVIIEAPSSKSSNQKFVEAYFEEKGGKIIANPPTHLQSAVGPIYLFEVHKKHLLKRYWQYHKKIRLGEYTILSNFKEKKLIKNKKKPKEHAIVDWVPGINLFTFKKLAGLWPEKDEIIKMILPMATIDHNDFRISNLIIQGLKIEPIDGWGKGQGHEENTVADFMPHLLSQIDW